LNCSIHTYSKLTRRYKYLQKRLEETLEHLLQYINKFGDNGPKLSRAFGMLIAMQIVPMTILSQLKKEHLVKDGEFLQPHALFYL
jgi:hypothetical protein